MICSPPVVTVVWRPIKESTSVCAPSFIIDFLQGCMHTCGQRRVTRDRAALDLTNSPTFSALGTFCDHLSESTVNRPFLRGQLNLSGCPLQTRPHMVSHSSYVSGYFLRVPCPSRLIYHPSPLFRRAASLGHPWISCSTPLTQ